MPKKPNCNWAPIRKIRALNTPLTELCGKPDPEIIAAIKHMEHREKVDIRKRKGCCDQ